MTNTKSIVRSASLLSMIAMVTWLPAAAHAVCDATDPTLNFTAVPPVTVADLANQSTIDTKFDQRADAAQNYSAECALAFNDGCNRTDLGQAFHHRLFAYLADPAKRQQALDYLLSVERDDFGEMGTTAPLGDLCETTLEDVVGFLPDLATDLGRHGEGDIAMIGLVTALHKYALPANVASHVLSLIDEEPTVGGVETVSFGLSTLSIGSICALVCATPCTGGPSIPCAACVIPCAIALEGEAIDAPETENHLNAIYVAQYLANQKRFELTGNRKYDNARNGYRVRMISRMRDFVRNDFIEYNAHPYQNYTMYALLSLASFATDPAVKDAAKMALDYVSAKVAVSSNDLLRSTPFRRRDEPNHICKDLFDGCADPQTNFYQMLTGLGDVSRRCAAGPNNGAACVVDSECPSSACNTTKHCAAGPNANAACTADSECAQSVCGAMVLGATPPAGFVEGFGWVAATDYRLDPLLLDLFVDRSHRKFCQFLRYGRVLQFDGFSDVNDELYCGSPSYLISAGGHAAHYAATATVPFPINLIPFIGGKHPGSAVDLGRTVPTTLMPTGDLRSRDRDKLIWFHEDGGENMCVHHNFACGLNPNVPNDYPGRVDSGLVTAAGLDAARWTVFDLHGPPGQPGYYVALYREQDFGFLEAYDTFTNPQSLADVNAFMGKVDTNNPTLTVTRDGVSSYKTADGTVLEFLVDARIVTINGVPPIRDRTNGDVINTDGQGLLTITNPGLPGRSLTLNAAIPPDHPTISVPGPIHFPNTCLGTTSYATLDVCNVNSAADDEDLFIYNILPKNAQIAATEPSSGYPVTVSHDFCYPFQVHYTPTVHGSLTSSFIVSNSDPEQDYLRVDVTGTSLPGTISTVIADNGAFGNVCRNTYKDLDLTIANVGGCDLVVSNITSSAPEFKTATVMNFPLVVQPGTSTHVPIRLAPTSLGAKSANITIASNDPSTPSKVIPVTGNAPPGDLRLTGSTDFGDVCAGTLAEKQLAVCNVGLCDLNVSSAAFVGTCADFALINNPFPAAVSPDSCEDLTIRFTPTSCGPKSCTLQIATDDPDALTTNVTVTANTPCSEVDVPPDVCFAPTVIQSVGACTTSQPFPILNKGKCPVPITAITTSAAQYSLSGLPSFPINLQPGHTVGDGALNIVFAPTVLARNTPATISVTYEQDPVTHATTTVPRALNGEGVRTGARVLVKYNGTPVALVDKIMIQRIGGNRNKSQVDSVDNALNLPLTTFTPAAPCPPFKYHREYGTVSNPIQLLPGSYQINATATVGKKKYSKAVAFDANTCTFNPNIVVNLP